jgi:hypothetical protein
MTGPFLPNSELVAKAWLLAAVTGLTGKVATQLPDQPWTDNEFVQIMQVGGDVDIDLPRRMPVVSMNCFAVKPNSVKPPFGQANQLCNRIWLATQQHQYNPSTSVGVNLPTNYMDAIVQSVWAVSEPKRVPSDPSQYAVYNIDVAFVWVPDGLVIARV